MAETAAILAPDKVVLLPEISAGCPLADMVTAKALQEKKARHTGAAVVAYINSPAEVKAQSDICVTSSNALRSGFLDAEKYFCAGYEPGQLLPGKRKKIILWDGYARRTTMLPPGPCCQGSTFRCGCNGSPECRPRWLRLLIMSFQRWDDKFARMQALKNNCRDGDRPLHRLEKENPEKQFCPFGDYSARI